jgi:TonB-linked SusC/RagA family outer membrane protein
MNGTLKAIALTLGAWLFMLPAGAQTQSYTGTVLDKQSRPVPKASVNVLGDDSNLQTDEKGIFRVEAAAGDTVIISHASFKTMQYILTPALVFNVTLEHESFIPLKPSVPVQQIYHTVPARLAIASNDAVYTNELVKSPVISVRNALIGRLAGYYTQQSSGQPGADGVSGSLRGQNPLVIIDGVVANLTVFDLEEIESVTVLKDALGTAMMGVRSNPGALVITTRKGAVDKLQLSFTAQTAVQKPFGRPKTLDAYDYATLFNEAALNDGLPNRYSDSALMAYRNNSDPFRYPNINWRDQVLEESSRFNRYTLTATGGNRTARYFVALEHLKQGGFLKTVDSNAYNTNNDFSSYVIRSNVDINVTRKLTGGIYLMGRILNSNEPGATTNSILASLLNTPPTAYPMYNPDGSYGGSQVFSNNIWAQTIGSGYRQNYKRDMLANFYLRRSLDELAKGLYVQARVGYNATISENINRSKTFAVFQRSVSPTGQETYQQFGTNGTQVNFNGIDYQGRSDYEEVRLGYDRNFGEKHGFNGLLMVNRDNSVDGSDLPYTISGGSGRLSYNYKGRYVVEGAFGYNGSNRYPEKGSTKRGFTPAIGFAWNIDGEDFTSDMPWISALKLFTSYGRTAWDAPGYFTYYQRYFDAATSFFGTGATGNTSIAQQTLANPNITWEKANKFNLGLSSMLFNNHLDFTVEYYNNKYFDLLQQRGRNSSLIGNTYPNENIGQERYSGLEMRLGWQELNNAFQYYIRGNATIQNTEVLYSDEVYRPFEWMQRTGRQVGQRFGYTAEGLFQTQAEIDNSPTTQGYRPKPGDIRYKDLNSDGLINEFDIGPIGTDKPPVFFGLGWGAAYKGIDFSALLQGVTNREVYIGGGSIWAFQNTGIGGFGQAYEDNLNRWTPATAGTATFPRLGLGTNLNNQAFSSFWLKSGNYLRLKNIELGYTVPPSLTSRIRLQSARVFVSGYNLLTFSSDELGGRDPEVTSAFSYPIQKLYNFGINIKF